jgi:hypothetical protein
MCASHFQSQRCLLAFATVWLLMDGASFASAYSWLDSATACNFLSATNWLCSPTTGANPTAVAGCSSTPPVSCQLSGISGILSLHQLPVEIVFLNVSFSPNLVIVTDLQAKAPWPMNLNYFIASNMATGRYGRWLDPSVVAALHFFGTSSSLTFLDLSYNDMFYGFDLRRLPTKLRYLNMTGPSTNSTYLLTSCNYRTSVDIDIYWTDTSRAASDNLLLRNSNLCTKCSSSDNIIDVFRTATSEECYAITSVQGALFAVQSTNWTGYNQGSFTTASYLGGYHWNLTNSTKGVILFTPDSLVGQIPSLNGPIDFNFLQSGPIYVSARIGRQIVGPLDLRYLASTLTDLDVSDNNFIGTPIVNASTLPPSLSAIRLRNNSFSGAWNLSDVCQDRAGGSGKSAVEVSIQDNLFTGVYVLCNAGDKVVTSQGTGCCTQSNHTKMRELITDTCIRTFDRQNTRTPNSYSASSCRFWGQELFPSGALRSLTSPVSQSVYIGSHLAILLIGEDSSAYLFWLANNTLQQVGDPRNGKLISSNDLLNGSLISRSPKLFYMPKNFLLVPNDTDKTMSALFIDGSALRKIEGVAMTVSTSYSATLQFTGLTLAYNASDAYIIVSLSSAIYQMTPTSRLLVGGSAAPMRDGCAGSLCQTSAVAQVSAISSLVSVRSDGNSFNLYFIDSGRLRALRGDPATLMMVVTMSVGNMNGVSIQASFQDSKVFKPWTLWMSTSDKVFTLDPIWNISDLATDPTLTSTAAGTVFYPFASIPLNRVGSVYADILETGAFVVDANTAGFSKVWRVRCIIPSWTATASSCAQRNSITTTAVQLDPAWTQSISLMLRNPSRDSNLYFFDNSGALYAWVPSNLGAPLMIAPNPLGGSADFAVYDDSSQRVLLYRNYCLYGWKFSQSTDTFSLATGTCGNPGNPANGLSFGQLGAGTSVSSGLENVLLFTDMDYAVIRSYNNGTMKPVTGSASEARIQDGLIIFARFLRPEAMAAVGLGFGLDFFVVDAGQLRRAVELYIVTIPIQGLGTPEVPLSLADMTMIRNPVWSDNALYLVKKGQASNSTMLMLAMNTTGGVGSVLVVTQLGAASSSSLQLPGQFDPVSYYLGLPLLSGRALTNINGDLVGVATSTTSSNSTTVTLTTCGLSWSNGLCRGAQVQKVVDQSSTVQASISIGYDAFVCANHSIVTGNASGVYTIAGQQSTPGNQDGVGTSARFRFPRGLTFIQLSTERYLFVADTGNKCLRRISLSTLYVTAFFGTCNPDLNDPFRLQSGFNARLYAPWGIASDWYREVLYVTDYNRTNCLFLVSAGNATVLGNTACDELPQITQTSDPQDRFQKVQFALHDNNAPMLFVEARGRITLIRVNSQRTSFQTKVLTVPGMSDACPTRVDSCPFLYLGSGTFMVTWGGVVSLVSESSSLASTLPIPPTGHNSMSNGVNSFFQSVSLPPMSDFRLLPNGKAHGFTRTGAIFEFGCITSDAGMAQAKPNWPQSVSIPTQPSVGSQSGGCEQFGFFTQYQYGKSLEGSITALNYDALYFGSSSEPLFYKFSNPLSPPGARTVVAGRPDNWAKNTGEMIGSFSSIALHSFGSLVVYGDSANQQLLASFPAMGAILLFDLPTATTSLVTGAFVNPRALHVPVAAQSGNTPKLVVSSNDCVYVVSQFTQLQHFSLPGTACSANGAQGYALPGVLRFAQQERYPNVLWILTTDYQVLRWSNDMIQRVNLTESSGLNAAWDSLPPYQLLISTDSYMTLSLIGTNGIKVLEGQSLNSMMSLSLGPGKSDGPVGSVAQVTNITSATGASPSGTFAFLDNGTIRLSTCSDGCGLVSKKLYTASTFPYPGVLTAASLAAWAPTRVVHCYGGLNWFSCMETPYGTVSEEPIVAANNLLVHSIAFDVPTGVVLFTGQSRPALYWKRVNQTLDVNSTDSELAAGDNLLSGYADGDALLARFGQDTTTPLDIIQNIAVQTNLSSERLFIVSDPQNRCLRFFAYTAPLRGMTVGTFAGHCSGPTTLTPVDGTGMQVYFVSPFSLRRHPTAEDWLYLLDTSNKNVVVRRILLSSQSIYDFLIVSTVFTFEAEAGVTTRFPANVLEVTPDHYFVVSLANNSLVFGVDTDKNPNGRRMPPFIRSPVIDILPVSNLVRRPPMLLLPNGTLRFADGFILSTIPCMSGFFRAPKAPEYVLAAKQNFTTAAPNTTVNSTLSPNSTSVSLKTTVAPQISTGEPPNSTGTFAPSTLVPVTSSNTNSPTASTNSSASMTPAPCALPILVVLPLTSKPGPLTSLDLSNTANFTVFIQNGDSNRWNSAFLGTLGPGAPCTVTGGTLLGLSVWNSTHVYVSVGPGTGLSISQSTPVTFSFDPRMFGCFPSPISSPALGSALMMPNVTFVFAAQPQLLPVEVKKATQALSATTGAVASLSGGSTLAVQTARAALVISLSQCDFSHSAELDATQSPTNMRFGSIVGGYYRGGTIGNLIIFLGCVVAHLILCLIWFLARKSYRDQGFLKGYPAAMTRMHFPGLLIIPLSMILPGMAMTSMALYLHGPDPGDAVLATFGVLFCVGWIGFYTYQTVKKFDCEWIWEEVELANGMKKVGNELSMLHRVFHGTRKWEDTGSHFKSAYGPVFGDYRKGFHWYMTVELCIGFLAGLLDGVRPKPGGCVGVGIGSLLCNAAILLSGLFLRPCITAFNVAHYIVNAILVFVSSLLLVISFFNDDDDVLSGAAELLSSIAIYIALAKSIFDVLLMIQKIQWKQIADALKKKQEVAGERRNGQDRLSVPLLAASRKPRDVFEDTDSREGQEMTRLRGAHAQFDRFPIDEEDFEAMDRQQMYPDTVEVLSDDPFLDLTDGEHETDQHGAPSVTRKSRYLKDREGQQLHDEIRFLLSTGIEGKGRAPPPPAEPAASQPTSLISEFDTDLL